MNFIVNSTELLDHLIRKEDSYISQTVRDLISVAIRSKTSNHEFDFFNETSYLPQSLRKTTLEKKILSTNLEIIKFSQQYGFSRMQEMGNSFGVNDGVDENDRYDAVSLFLDCLTKEEFEEYEKYELSEKDLRKAQQWYRRLFGQKVEISLPRFELITDYFGLMGFFDVLYDDYESLEAGEVYMSDNDEYKTIVQNDPECEIKTQGVKYRFKSNLIESKITQLYEKLIEKSCIGKLTSKEEFLWVFGVDSPDIQDVQIEWVKSKSLAVYFIDTLYSFNYINNNLKIWSIGGHVFSIKNMAQIKQNYFATNTNGKPKGYEVIDEIIDFL